MLREVALWPRNAGKRADDIEDFACASCMGAYLPVGKAARKRILDQTVRNLILELD
jgi:hypothetical protein